MINNQIGKLGFGAFADGGTISMSTIIDVNILSEKTKNLLPEKSEFELERLPENLRILQITKSKNSDILYVGYYKNGILLSDIMDCNLIKFIYVSLKKFLNDENISEGEKDKSKSIIFLNLIKPLLRNYNLNNILND